MSIWSSDVVGVMGSPKNIADRAPGQNVEILERSDGRLQEIEQTGSLMHRCYHDGGCGARRSEQLAAS